MPYYVTDDNVRIYYEEKGEGKPVVLVHGWSCNRRHFKKQTPELSKRYRVVHYDLRGHGDSDVPERFLTMKQFALDLGELIDYLGLKEVSLIGWSMGVHIIWEYVKQFGCDNLGKLCFIDMTPKLITDEEWKYGLYGNYSHKNNLATLAAMCKDWGVFTDQFVPTTFAKSGYDQDEYDWVHKQANKNTPHVMINMWIAMAIRDYRSVLPTITVPCLITYGEESQLYLPETSEYQKEQIPDAKLVSFPKCGHGLHMEDPDKFNKEVMDFIG